MILLTILLFIFARSLSHEISPIFTTRMAALALFFSFALTFNALYIQIIGSGIGIYCGLFTITYYSLFIESFIYLIGSIILLSWGFIYTKESDKVKSEGLIELNLFNQLPSTSTDQLTDINRVGQGNYTAPTRATVTENSPITSINERESFKSLELLNTTKGSHIPTSSLFELGSNNSFEVPQRNIKSISTSSEAKDYSLICLFSILGSSFLISSGDLLSMYLSIELQSFGLYILATIYRESGSATNAGLKYFLLGGLSSCLILLGTGLIYAVTGLTDLNSIYSIVSVLSSMPSDHLISNSENSSVVSSSLDSLYGSYALTENFNLGLSLGFIFIIVGFLFKIAAAPFHNWSLGPLYF
jgi:hypothetical protein